MNINNTFWICTHPECNKIWPLISKNQVPEQCSEEKTFTHDPDGKEYEDGPRTETHFHDPAVPCVVIRMAPDLEPALAREWINTMDPLKIQDSRKTG